MYIETVYKNVDCYGDIRLDSNFSVCCDDEDFDGIVADINTEQYNTWEKVVDYLLENFRKDIVEITTC